MSDPTEPSFPVYEGPRCDACGCPTEKGTFINGTYKRVCLVCWELFFNKRFEQNPSYWG